MLAVHAGGTSLSHGPGHIVTRELLSGRTRSQFTQNIEWLNRDCRGGTFQEQRGQAYLLLSAMSHYPRAKGHVFA